MYQPIKRLSQLLFFSLLTTLLITSCSSSKNDFSKKDVKRSQKLIGLDFDKKYIDTLYPYLQRNKEGFDSLRKYTLDYDVVPAVRFDPLPMNFTPKTTIWVSRMGNSK